MGKLYKAARRAEAVQLGDNTSPNIFLNIIMYNYIINKIINIYFYDNR